MTNWNKVNENSFKTMMRFAEMGGWKANIPALKENVGYLLQMANQKTMGQRGGGHIDSEYLETVMMNIAIEACCLVLSGTLDGLEDTPGAEE